MFLGILIIIAFITLIYGMYLKISINPKDMTLKGEKISLNLKKDEQIIDIKIIDNNRLLLVIKSSGNIKGAIYNIKKDRISKFIVK